MNIKIKIVLFLILLPNILIWAITREDVLSNAQSYSNFNWTVNTVNTRYPIYSIKGTDIMGEAYSYGNKQNVFSFQSAIEDSLIPRNWMANHTWENHFYYAGIDCSGLVTRCLEFNNDLVLNTGAGKIPIYCVGITQAKPGDIWIGPGHTFLQAYGGQVYEANPQNNPSGGNRVQCKANYYTGFGKYSIFPQFSKESPSDGAVKDSGNVDSISVMICGKGISTNNVSMIINDLIETNTVVKPINDTSVQFVSYDSTFFDSLKGEVNVEVVARANSMFVNCKP